MTDDKSGVKVCRDCGAAKALTDFWQSKVSPDGHSPYCKPCFKRRNALSAARRASREGREFRPRKSSTLPVPTGMKFCPRCEQVLPLDHFVRNRSTKSGFGSYCRPCQNAKAAETIKRLHGSTRHYHLKRRYGHGAAEVEQMLDGQRWACLVCDTALTLKTAHVDHDHATGAIRGVLCFNCNGGLGQFRDNAITLRRAASYIERSGRRRMRVAEDGRGGSLVELAWARVVRDRPRYRLLMARRSQ